MQRQTSITDSFLSHHRCLRGMLHLSHGMKILIGVGLTALAALLILESLYFRRGIFILSIPFCVTLCTIYATVTLKRSWIKPIIGISPLYIIMVLNWAFDTLYTYKTFSYYVQCFCIFTSIVSFGFFNLWQLTVSQDYCEYLDAVAHTETATTKSQQTGVTSLDTLNEKRQPVVLVVNRNSSEFNHPPSGHDYRLVL